MRMLRVSGVAAAVIAMLSVLAAPAQAGATVTVEEPPGTVRVLVTDADSGDPVPSPCVYIGSTPKERQACGTGGLVVLADVPPGKWEITFGGGVSYFPIEDEDRQVTVQSGKTTTYEVALEPAASLRTKVVDAATGAPIAGVCVRLIDAVWSATSAHMERTCTEPDGTLELGPYDGGATVNVYAFQPANPWDPPAVRYGDQWVGADGGTGDQRKALTITVAAKTAKTIPVIRMDPPATITGTIRDASTGAPVNGVCAYPYSWHPGQGGTVGAHCTNAQGTYSIDDIGPYAWPVEFTPYAGSGYAWQWSGDVADRFAATFTAARPGTAATVDAKLVKGGSVTGTVTEGKAALGGAFVAAYNRRTRDYAGPSWFYSDQQGAFRLSGFRSQDLWVEYYAKEKGCWYGTGPKAPSPVKVTAGQAGPAVAVDLTTTCAPAPVAGTAEADRAPARLLTAVK